MLLTLCVLFVFFSFNANSSSFNSNLVLKHFSAKDGLTQSSINTMMQDKQGFIWIGTELGLDVYDGYRFRELEGLDHKLSNSGVYKIHQDYQGDIWYATTNGLYIYNKQHDEYKFAFDSAPVDTSNYIVDLLELKNGIFWVLTTKALVKYDKNLREIVEVIDFTKQLKAEATLNKVIYHNNMLFISSMNGAYVIDLKSKKQRLLPYITENIKSGARSVYQLYADTNNVLYLGTYDGLYTLDISHVESYLKHDTALPSYRILDANLSVWSFAAHKNTLYVGSHIGLSKVDLTTHETSYLFGFNDVYDNINSNVISSLMVDKSGVLWLGSYVTGMFRWDPKQSLVDNYRFQKSNINSLSHNVVWAVLADKNDPNKSWVATENGLNLIDHKTRAVKRYLVQENSLSIYHAGYINRIHHAADNKLWLSTMQGVQLFDIATGKLVPLPYSKEVKDLLSQEHYGIELDGNGQLWLLTKESFHLLDVKTGKLDLFNELTEFLPDNKVFKILGFLPNSQKMMLSSNVGLWLVDKTTREVKEVFMFPEGDDKEWSSINNWLVDKEGTLWLTHSTKGIFALDSTTFELKKHYSHQTHGIAKNLYGLMLDDEDDFWFSSHNGIYLLNPRTDHIRNFNIIDGFPAKEFNGRAYTKLPDGRFAYGSINGVSFFDPLKLKNKSAQGAISPNLTNISILSRELSLPIFVGEQNVISLNYDDVGIRFDFSDLEFSYQPVQFQFQLTGTKPANFPLTTDNYITLARLAPGKHQLKVAVKSLQTGKLSKPKSINIVVSYPWWESPLAYVVYSLIALSIVFFWWYRRRRYTFALLNAHEQVKTREQRLSLALKGSNSAEWDWHAASNTIYGERVQQELGFDDIPTSYTVEQHLSLIHDSDREMFIHQWRAFILSANVNDSFSCTYRLRTKSGEWYWYKDLGKVVEVDEVTAKPTRITGSYTNITEARVEAERAEYYGDAFQQTQDWVLIISDNYSRIIANNSLQEAFGWKESEFNFDQNVFGLGEEKTAFYRKLFNSFVEGDHWRGEELITTNKGEQFHVLLNINVSRNQTTDTLHYVCIFTDITAQKNAEKELRYMANYDHLTDLPNRSLLLERVKHAIDYSSRTKKSIALFFIDLDRFKQVNDTLGHDCGDLLLREITQRLSKTLRVNDTVARIGGDEFVVLLETYNDNSQLSKIAQKLITVVGKPIELKGTMVNVGASIGIALYPEDANDSDELLKNADVAMYHAKQKGRNTFQFFTSNMNEEASKRLAMEAKIKDGIVKKEFINYYQPIVDAKSGKAIGVEMLMRWQHEEQLISPAEFIPLAEEMGLIIEMTEQAIIRGLSDLKAWLKYRENMILSINIAVTHFSKPELCSFLAKLLTDYEIPASALKLEITESTLISEPEKMIDAMFKLKELGVCLALDDFGTGYSSLSYLKKLPLEVIKIDKCFVDGIANDSKDEAIIEATLVLAKSLNMNCIAEGVETQEQLNYLAEHGCFTIQGYLYSKPVPATVITQYLEEDKVEIKVI